MGISDVPDELAVRRDAYCEWKALSLSRLRGYGLDGFVWQTNQDSVLKIFRERRRREFERELGAYQRLQSRRARMVQGFAIPVLLDYDEKVLALELSYVEPPFILDFAEVRLDQPLPADEAESLVSHVTTLYGAHAPEVLRLLDSLRHWGLHYRDVHLGNIRFDPAENVD